MLLIYKLLAAFGLVAVVLTGAYIKGRSDANAICREAELQRQLYAQALTVERYRVTAENEIAMRQKEATEALARQEILKEQINDAAKQRIENEARANELEADLSAAINDKEKLNGILVKLRKSNPSCRVGPDLRKRDCRLLRNTVDPSC